MSENVLENHSLCHFCQVCDGQGCVGEMPGMGGAFASANFIANCAEWKRYQPSSDTLPLIRLAPITGAVENIGWHDEKSFYFALLGAAAAAGIRLSIGDGTPDEKLQAGIEALRALKKKAAVFIKPYPQKIFFERLEWAEETAEICGSDIDSYNIVTMRKLVHLERKTPAQLLEIKKRVKVPFAIKGVFTPEDLDIIKEVKPDIAVISNHGGRVETRQGSTASFLAEHAVFLRKFCGELWVDGGLRTQSDLLVAHSLGASTVMIGRPFITALLQNGQEGVARVVQNFLSDGKTQSQ